MNIYNILEAMRRLITWPIRLLIAIPWTFVGLMATHWDRYTERDYFKKSILNLIKPI